LFLTRIISFFFSVCTFLHIFFFSLKKPHSIYAKPHHYDHEKKCLKKKPKKSAQKCAFGFFLSKTFRFLGRKMKKVQKSDFPRKRSHFRKKVLGFVTTKKKFHFYKTISGILKMDILKCPKSTWPK